MTFQLVMLYLTTFVSTCVMLAMLHLHTITKFVDDNSWLKTHKGNMPRALASYNAGYNVNAGLRYSSSIINKATYLRDNNILRTK